jgi:hypothetical protein
MNVWLLVAGLFGVLFGGGVYAAVHYRRRRAKLTQEQRDAEHYEMSLW